MSDNYTPIVTMSLTSYENREDRLRQSYDDNVRLVQENLYLNTKVDELAHALNEKNIKLDELTKDNERLCRLVDGLRMEHRNDQGLD